MKMPNHSRLKFAALVVVPLALFGLLFWRASFRPRFLPGLGGEVTAVQFSPDGKTIVCATTNGLVQVWKPEIEKWRSFPESEDFRRGMIGVAATIERLRFSPDGTKLVGGGVQANQYYSRPLRVWDVARRRWLSEVGYTKSPAFDFSPDGKTLIGGYNETIGIWDITRKPEISKTSRRTFVRGRTLKLHTMPVTALSFSPDGTNFASAGYPLEGARIVELKTGKTIRALQWPNNLQTATDIAWSPDGTRIAAATQDSQICLWDARTGQLLHTTVQNTAPGAVPNFGTRPDTARFITWSPDAKRLAVSGNDGVAIWDADSCRPIRQLAARGPAAWAPDNRTLATGAAGGRAVLLWKM